MFIKITKKVRDRTPRLAIEKMIWKYFLRIAGSPLKPRRSLVVHLLILPKHIAGRTRCAGFVDQTPSKRKSRVTLAFDM